MRSGRTSCAAVGRTRSCPVRPARRPACPPRSACPFPCQSACQGRATAGGRSAACAPRWGRNRAACRAGLPDHAAPSCLAWPGASAGASAPVRIPRVRYRTGQQQVRGATAAPRRVSQAGPDRQRKGGAGPWIAAAACRLAQGRGGTRACPSSARFAGRLSSTAPVETQAGPPRPAPAAPPNGAARPRGTSARPWGSAGMPCRRRGRHGSPALMPRRGDRAAQGAPRPCSPCSGAGARACQHCGNRVGSAAGRAPTRPAGVLHNLPAGRRASSGASPVLASPRASSITAGRETLREGECIGPSLQGWQEGVRTPAACRCRPERGPGAHAVHLPCCRPAGRPAVRPAPPGRGPGAHAVHPPWRPCPVDPAARLAGIPEVPSSRSMTATGQSILPHAWPASLSAASYQTQCPPRRSILPHAWPASLRAVCSRPPPPAARPRGPRYAPRPPRRARRDRGWKGGGRGARGSPPVPARAAQEKIALISYPCPPPRVGA